MALTNYVKWIIRTGGNEINGGGFDASISGAGTNYSDQNSAQLALTDLTSTASTTVTSVAAGFTAQMVGNILRIASGSGSPTTGYYMITGYTNSTTITLDRVSGTYTLGVAKVGGAWATLVNVTNGGAGLSTPALTTPLLAGHTIYMRSAGSSADPTIASPDYDYSAGYWQVPTGDSTNGKIKLIGLGASEAIPADGVVPSYRPCVKFDGLLFYLAHYWDMFNIKFFFKSSPDYVTYGPFYGTRAMMRYCIIDMNGIDANVFRANSDCYGTVRNNWIKNTGSTSAGTASTISAGYYTCQIIDNLITDVRGNGIIIGLSAHIVRGNVIANPHAHGITAAVDDAYANIIDGNTIYNPTGDGINVAGVFLHNGLITNNTISKIASGQYAINITDGSAAVNDRYKSMVDYNNLYLDGGAGTLRNNISASAHDTNLDPQFTDPSMNDFSVGTNLKATGLGITPLA